MLLVTQDAERLFAGEVSNCLRQKTSTRCIILKLSGIVHRPDDWQTQIAEAIEHCLGSEGRIFFHDSGDVTALVRNATRREFSRLTDMLATPLAPAPLGELAFLCELPMDMELVMRLFPGAQKAQREPPDASRTEEQTKIDLVDPELVRTIGLRRKKRTVADILIVEDDPFLQRLIGTLFARDFRVVSARCGSDAINLYIKHAPDIVFLDIGLPDMSGHDILARVLALDSMAHIVMLSGHGNRENVIRAIDEGAKGFVGKPFTPEKLLSYINKCPFIQEKQRVSPERR